MPEHVPETRAAPISSSERLPILDVLRGFALLGVLIANTGWFTGRYFGGRHMAPPASALDTAATHFVQIFVAGKSMTLLSCLFGFGFAVTLLRADARGESGVPLFARRLAVLFLIGCCHVGLLWWGDVTWVYATCGFALLAFRRVDRALVPWALALIFLPTIAMTVPEIAAAAKAILPAPPPTIRAETAAIIQGDDRVALAWAHARWVYYFVGAIVLSFFPWIIGRFLLGYYAGKHRLFDADGAAHLPLFRRLLGWGIVVFVGTNATMIVTFVAFSDYELLATGKIATAIVHELSVLGTVAAYVGLTVFLMRRAAWRRVLLVMAPVGRMPLTAYLLQSLTATAIYYGWGFGYGASQGQARELAISIAIFACEIALCHVWLRYFRFGPAEWVWRSLVYGRAQPMRG